MWIPERADASRASDGQVQFFGNRAGLGGAPEVGEGVGRMDDLPEPHRIVHQPGLLGVGIDEGPSPAERRGALEDVGRPDDLLQDTMQNGGVVQIRVIGIEHVSEEEKFPVPILCHRDRQVGVGRQAEAIGDGMPLPGISTSLILASGIE